MTADIVVLDTNATLDWLVFKDPGMQPLVAAVEARQVHWAACPRMRAELAHMLSHVSLARWRPDVTQALVLFDRWALIHPEPATSPQLRCSDVDDQMFVDLALALRARWLVSHDRALLRLARRLRGQGVQVLKPAQWAAACNTVRATPPPPACA
jgi:predicted nucleic acid-binding protein